MNHIDESAPAARLNAFLATDPRDVGCERAMELLHVYVDVVADGGSQERFAGVVAHLRACGPCSEEFDGLLDAVSEGWGGPGVPRDR
ncbi:hypothetical protein [Streptomyces sp. NBC_01497]|uniref:hypothetical protein n=1 Tax=Streptomyces sp. NBC_01497 TaxID=2903885 RepID=UPI002E33F956|nr:hypothetical protein [Streptomyces sp. NBC_01497]